MSETVDSAAVPDKGGRDRADKPQPSRTERIALFYRQVVAELRKVIWPTRKELLTYTYVVIVFVIVVALIVAGFDLVFTKLVLKVFGG